MPEYIVMLDETQDESEEARMRVLESLEVLDTQDDWRYNSVTALAAEIFNAPVAAVSFVDRSRQWFKSKLGMELDETAREVSFCQHAIKGSEAFIVHDASIHELFKDNPLVTGSTAFRFYAGAPIYVMGQNVGAVCVIDRRAVEPRSSDISKLMLLASIAAGFLQSDYEIVKLRRKLLEFAGEGEVTDTFAA